MCYYHILFRCPIINSSTNFFQLYSYVEVKRCPVIFIFSANTGKTFAYRSVTAVSGLLLTAIITSVFLFIREEINREVETGYDTFGKYDLILSGIPNDIKTS